MVESKVYAMFLNVGDLFIRIVVLQLLFLLFTGLGLGVLGFFPAFLAMMAVFRHDALKSVEQSVFKLFLHYFKAVFMKANLLGWLFSMIIFMIWSTMGYYQHLPTIFGSIMVSASYLALCAVLLVIIYGTPLTIHLNTTLFHALRGCLLIALLRPLHSIAIALSIIMLGFFAGKSLFFMTFFAFAIGAFLWIHIALHAFTGYITERVSG